MSGLSKDYQALQKALNQDFPNLSAEFDIILSACSVMKIKSHTAPIGVMLVGPPSVGKTTCCNFLTVNDDERLFGAKTLISDEFSQAALLSAAPGVDPEESLLNQLSGNILLTPEMSVVAASKDVRRLMSTMTRAFDAPSDNAGGNYERHTGFGKLSATIKKFAWIPAIVEDGQNFPKLMHDMGSTGYRLMWLRFPKESLPYQESVARLVKMGKGKIYAKKVERIKKLVLAFSNHIADIYGDGVTLKRESDNTATATKIAELTKLSVRLCGIIQKRNREIIAEPLTEDDPRTYNTLYGICQGHAINNDRTTISESDIPIALRLSFDSAPKWRSELLRMLIATGGNVTSQLYLEYLKAINSVTQSSKRSLAIVHARFDEITCLGITKLSKTTGITKPFKTLELSDEHAWLLDLDAAINERTVISIKKILAEIKWSKQTGQSLS